MRYRPSLASPLRLRRARRPHAALGALLLLVALTHPAAASEPSPLYPLDGVARVLGPGDKLPCARGQVELVTYRGERLRYHTPLRVHPAFVAQLRAFEAIVEEIAIAHYGRAPRRIVHLGSYACRVMRRYPEWVSEHALGNALDVAGFDFGPLPRGATRSELPARLQRPFEVRLERHWQKRGQDARHAAFLRDLAEHLIARPDVFHVVLGPAWPGHHNHFHLDHAPYRVVEVFEDQERTQ